VTDHDFGDDQDPLLVRPFVLQDSGSPDADPSTQTWPSATTREVRSQHASSAEPPTQVIPRIAALRRPFRRRLLVIGGVGAVVVLAAAAAAFAALRPDVSPSVASGADSGLPVVTGPAPSASAPPTAGSPSAASQGARHSGSASAKASASLSASAGTPSSSPPTSRPASAPAVSTTGGGFGVAQPHNVPTTARTGTIRGQNALCLDLNGNLPFDDNHVDVFGCNATSAQVWTLATDGTLRVDGKCALIVGDNSVHIVSCDGRTTAQWQASNSTLINAANGQCLTDPSGGRTEGTTVVVTTCGGSASRRWSLP
jgi:hypothetical protein